MVLLVLSFIVYSKAPHTVEKKVVCVFALIKLDEAARLGYVSHHNDPLSMVRFCFFPPPFAGHLPVKLPDYNNRLRVLVATYVTFSPDGTELLVNMGGEQVS